MITKSWFAISAIACLTIGSIAAVAQTDPRAPRTPGKPGGDKFFGKKEKKPENVRSLEGAVFDLGEKIVSGAVVQLKDTKTLRVRSFVTPEDGKYHFHGLSTETDYEVKATYKGRGSKVRRLTVFDARKKANIDLKLEPEG